MKKAIVVGGTTGIGYGVAEILVENNYKVVVTGIEKEIIDRINAADNDNFKAQNLDCINSSTSAEISKIIERLETLDLLVFSAGIGNLNKDLGYTVENKANQLNVLAFTEIADYSYRFFEKQGYGHFVGVTSFSGLFGSRVAPAYHAAKAYQISYLEGLMQKAKRSKKPIYFTDARPGFVETPMTEGKTMFWTATADKAAKQIFRLIKRKKTYGYITKRWAIAGTIVKGVPKFIRVRV